MQKRKKHHNTAQLNIILSGLEYNDYDENELDTLFKKLHLFKKTLKNIDHHRQKVNKMAENMQKRHEYGVENDANYAESPELKGILCTYIEFN